MPLACDLMTDEVLWPAKQTMTIEHFDPNNSLLLDSSHLPVINVDKNSEMHSSLRELVNKVTSGDSYTIDFDHHGLQIDQVTSYSIYAQSIITIVVVINSLMLAFLVIKWIYRKKISHKLSHDSNSPLQNKFRGLKNSVRLRKDRFSFTKGSKTFRDSFRVTGSNIRDALKNEANQLKHRIQASPKAFRKPSSTLNIPLHVETGTNTDVNAYPPVASVADLYPALPRYI